MTLRVQVPDIDTLDTRIVEVPEFSTGIPDSWVQWTLFSGVFEMLTKPMNGHGQKSYIG